MQSDIQELVAKVKRDAPAKRDRDKCPPIETALDLVLCHLRGEITGPQLGKALGLKHIKTGTVYAGIILIRAYRRGILELTKKDAPHIKDSE